MVSYPPLNNSIISKFKCRNGTFLLQKLHVSKTFFILPNNIWLLDIYALKNRFNKPSSSVKIKWVVEWFFEACKMGCWAKTASRFLQIGCKKIMDIRCVHVSNPLVCRADVLRLVYEIHSGRLKHKLALRVIHLGGTGFGFLQPYISDNNFTCHFLYSKILVWTGVVITSLYTSSSL